MKATKIRIYTTKKQAEFLIDQFSVVGFAYNPALRIKRHRDKRHGGNVNIKMHIKPLLSVLKKSRKTKGSVNRSKARLLVSKCHEKVKNARHDFQHKLSKIFINENQAIIVETLKSSNMLKNHKISKHIPDALCYIFVEKREYKARLYGKHFVKIDQWYVSSKRCHCCGHRVKEMPLSLRVSDCPSCHIKNIDRDVNAAINLKNKGIIVLKAGRLSVTACRVPVRRDIYHTTDCEAISIAL